MNSLDKTTISDNPLFLSYPVCITPYLRFESGPEESYEEKIAYL